MGLARGPGVSHVPASGPCQVAVPPWASGTGFPQAGTESCAQDPPEPPSAAFQDQRRLLSVLGFEGRGQACGVCVQGGGVEWGKLSRGDAEAYRKSPCS